MAIQVSSSNVVSGAEHVIIVFLLLVHNFVPAHEVCKLILVSMGGHLISHAIIFPSKLNVFIRCCPQCLWPWEHGHWNHWCQSHWVQGFTGPYYYFSLRHNSQALPATVTAPLWSEGTTLFWLLHSTSWKAIFGLTLSVIPSLLMNIGYLEAEQAANAHWNTWRKAYGSSTQLKVPFVTRQWSKKPWRVGTSMASFLLYVSWL